MGRERQAQIKRETGETSITLQLDLDGSGANNVDTGVGFLDHMLALFARHGCFDVDIQATGDLDVDAHHTTEDVGIVLGSGFQQALGDKIGINRFANVLLPMQEALAQIAIDISGRTFFQYQVCFPSQQIGQFDTELVEEFFLAFTHNAGITLHMDLLRGSNSHHIAEALFKGVARAMRSAVALDPGNKNSVPSTKGTL